MKKKLLVTALAAMPMLGMFGGNIASAKVVSDGIANSATEEVKVTVSQPSTFSVIIPKEIEETVYTSTYTDQYTVVVEGNIAGNETITVKPAASSFEMRQNNKTELIASVTQTQDNQTAVYSELKNGAKKNLAGKVEVSGVSAGTWKGTFNFDISLTATTVNP